MSKPYPADWRTCVRCGDTLPDCNVYAKSCRGCDHLSDDALEVKLEDEALFDREVYDSAKTGIPESVAIERVKEEFAELDRDAGYATK